MDGIDGGGCGHVDSDDGADKVGFDNGGCAASGSG